MRLLSGCRTYFGVRGGMVYDNHVWETPAARPGQPRFPVASTMLLPIDKSPERVEDPPRHCGQAAAGLPWELIDGSPSSWKG